MRFGFHFAKSTALKSTTWTFVRACRHIRTAIKEKTRSGNILRPKALSLLGAGACTSSVADPMPFPGRIAAAQLNPGRLIASVPDSKSLISIPVLALVRLQKQGSRIDGPWKEQGLTVTLLMMVVMMVKVITACELFARMRRELLIKNRRAVS